MTLFEYLTAAYTLVLSFAVIRALSGIAHAVRPARRYWVHAVWLSTMLVGSLVAFWAFWSYREVEWTLIRFSLVLTGPALIYVSAALLVPPDPSVVTSWRDYFFEVRVPFFATQTLFVATVFIGGGLVLGVPWTHPSRLLQLTMLAVYAIGFASDKPSVHSVLAAAQPGVVALVFLRLESLPGSLAFSVP